MCRIRSNIFWYFNDSTINLTYTLWEYLHFKSIGKPFSWLFSVLFRRSAAVGSCLSRTGEFAAARPWFERAVAEAEKGDVHGRVDHESLGTSLHEVGDC